MQGDTIHLVGYKSGDVNGDVYLNPSYPDSIVFLLPDIQRNAGFKEAVPVYIESDFDYSVLQLQLDGLQSIIEFDSILFNQLYSAIFNNPQDYNMRLLANDMIHLSPGTPLFYIYITPNQTILLKDAVKLSQSGIESFIADDECKPYQIVLEFRTNVAVVEPDSETFTVLKVSPNPFIDKAQIELSLASRAPVLLEVFDLSGMLLYSSNTELQAGAQQLEIPGGSFPENSMLLYRISAGGQSYSGKLFKSAKQ